jgi:1,5-anhydro-D-fructose reductase (1,5-anhydro-D-mannitol-forming)
MPVPDVIRWGIIGCGDVTEVKSGPGFACAHGSRLVAVMRRNGALAADYARRHGVPRWYDDARALVADPEVDAVYVATPPGAHLEGVRLAAAAGKPCHVEKPMARHTPECDAMLAACAAAGTRLFTAYYRRAMPRFIRARELATGGAIGRLTGVTYRHAAPLPAGNPWRIEAAHSGAGLFLDVGSHVLDFLDFCLGPLESVSGHAANTSGKHAVEDQVALTFRAAGGVTGACSWNFTSHTRDDTLTFFGTEGSLAFTFFTAEAIRMETARGTELFEIANPPHVAQPLIQTVVDDLLGRGTCPSTGESGRRTTVAMDAVLADYYGGRTDAFWERPATWRGAPLR